MKNVQGRENKIHYGRSTKDDLKIKKSHVICRCEAKGRPLRFKKAII